MFNLETNTVVESCDVTFDETAPCPRDVFECAGEKKMEESIFVDEGLQGVDGDEDELENFERNHVWTLVEPLRDVNVIGTKWVFKNK